MFDLVFYDTLRKYLRLVYLFKSTDEKTRKSALKTRKGLSTTSERSKALYNHFGLNPFDNKWNLYMLCYEQYFTEYIICKYHDDLTKVVKDKKLTQLHWDYFKDPFTD